FAAREGTGAGGGDRESGRGEPRDGRARARGPPPARALPLAARPGAANAPHLFSRSRPTVRGPPRHDRGGPARGTPEAREDHPRWVSPGHAGEMSTTVTVKSRVSPRVSGLKFSV